MLTETIINEISTKFHPYTDSLLRKCRNAYVGTLRPTSLTYEGATLFGKIYQLFPRNKEKEEEEKKAKKSEPKCPHCPGRTFRDNGDLKRHMRTHTGERPFNCNIDKCDKACRQRHGLTKHQRSAHGVVQPQAKKRKTTQKKAQTPKKRKPPPAVVQGKKKRKISSGAPTTGGPEYKASKKRKPAQAEAQGKKKRKIALPRTNITGPVRFDSSREVDPREQSRRSKPSATAPPT